MKMRENPKPKTRQNRINTFQVAENECIWMKAGVVNFRLCDNAYDCNTCPFDKAMQKAMGSSRKCSEKKAFSGWAEPLRKKYPGGSRPCRHTLTGRIDAPKICTLNYECYHCQFDQMLYEQDLTAVAEAPRYTIASGYRLAQGCYYHMGHTWARFEHGGHIRIGFDDFMVRLFGALQTIGLPPLGMQLEQDEIGCSLERDHHTASVLSPVSGKVLAVNHKVLEHPQIPHEDPYHQGWLMILDPKYPKKNLRRLYFGKESVQWIETENQELLSLMGPEYESLAATGGEPIGDVFGQFPEIGWDHLVHTFLKTQER
jgi:glycine cleavage system H lipoate-binding protein